MTFTSTPGKKTSGATAHSTTCPTTTGIHGVIREDTRRQHIEPCERELSVLQYVDITELGDDGSDASIHYDSESCGAVGGHDQESFRYNNMIPVYVAGRDKE